MRTEIAVVGGGLAGSLAAAMLGRAGYDVCAVDPHDRFPPEFRCEKLEEDHVAMLDRMGFASAIMQAGTHIETIWIARYGRLVDKMPLRQYAMTYDTMVNTIRDQIPPRVTTARAWVDKIETSAARQTIGLSNGGTIDARLVILASGLNWSLRESAGVKRDLVSACHSITLGFDISPTGRIDFAFPALQYFPEKMGRGVAYLTLFRIGQRMRANLFVYLPLKCPSVAAFRSDPDAALQALLPKLVRLIGGYTIQGPVKVRPTDLHATRDVERPGLVMVGDAFATPCPATGTGTIKVFNDVERLCTHHVPVWLASPGMGIEKIGTYYGDPAKVDCDASSAASAYTVRALAIDKAPYWRLQRASRCAARLVKWATRSAVHPPAPDRIRTPRPTPPSVIAPGT